MDRRFPLAVAPNGARRSAADHPALPLDARAIGATAAAVAEQGASILHLHVRDDNHRHVLDAERYLEASKQVRAATGNRIIVQITTEAVGRYRPEAQMAVVRTVRPEAVSLAVRELCPGPGEEAAFAAFMTWLRRERISPQVILYDQGDVARLNDLCARGVVPGPPPSVLYVLGRYADGRPATPPELVPFLDAAAGRYPDVMVCAFGPNEAACATAAVLLGGGARVGFENNLHLPDGSVASDNTALVRAVVEPLGRLSFVPEPVGSVRERIAAAFG